MKKIILTLLLFSCSLIATSDLSWVDAQIAAIKPPRKGLNTKSLKNLNDPFILLVEKKEPKKKKSLKKKVSKSKYIYKKKVQRRHYYFKLEAVMNKSALINGKWVRDGGYIHGYSVSILNSDTVILKKGAKRIKLSTMSKIKNIKLKKE